MAHKARKRFGQNFLQDETVLDRIIARFSPLPDQQVIEIGPGKGALTGRLLQHLPQMTAIELDRDLIKMLQSRFSADRLLLIESDVLKVDFSALGQADRPLRIIGNIPYNITTPIIFHAIKYRHRIDDLFLMVQREVALRLTASPNTKSYGRLGIMSGLYFKPEILFDVPAISFRPIPKIESCMIRLRPIETPSIDDEQLFNQVIGLAFNQRRKTIKNALSPLVSPTDLDACGIDEKLRAGAINPEQYITLVNYLNQRNS